MKRKINILGFEIPLITLILLAVLGGVTVFNAVEMATKGAELVYLEQKADRLTAENKEIESKLVAGSSLTKVSDKAVELGMVKPDNIVYLTSEAPVAAKLP